MNVVDWEQIARDMGTVQEEGTTLSQRGGDYVAKQGLERILGSEIIRSAVDQFIGGGPGSELARSVLVLLTSWEASQYAYEIYHSSTEDFEATDAAGIIASIAHPQALGWVEEFLRDERVAGWGINLLNQLIYTNGLDDEDEQERLLQLAEQHPSELVRTNAGWIRDYLNSLARSDDRT